MSVSMFFGVIGIILAAVEIWRPRLSAALEVTMIKQIADVDRLQPSS